MLIFNMMINSIYDSSRARHITKIFFDYKVKIELLRLDIWFNKQCKENNVTPNYINIKYNNKSKTGNIAINKAKSIWLNLEIKQLYSKIQDMTEKLYSIHLEIGKHRYDNKMDTLYSKHVKTLSYKLQMKRKRLNNKLNMLIRNNEKQFNHNKLNINKPIHKFNDRVVNKTNVNFTIDEIKYIELGHKHNNISMYNNEYTMKNTVAEIESVLKQIPYADREHARHLITDKLKEIQIKEKLNDKLENEISIQNKIIKSIKQKVKNNKLIITKSDKGNTTVILNKQIYIDKTIEFLNKNNIQQIKRDPTNIFQTNIKNTIKDTKYIFDIKSKKSLINMNPNAPYLKAYPKIHKDNMPIRPIINYRDAPAYKISKFMNTYINNNYIYTNNRSIKNSTDFAKHIHNINIKSNYEMISLDIVNMYANIPIDETITLIENNFTNNNVTNKHTINEAIILLRMIMKQNYFNFNNKTYIQNEGLPMGSPISGTMANVFIDHIENTFINSLKPICPIIEWLRYVDDIFIIFDNNLITAQEILDKINKLHMKIKFTMENEIKHKINHLDLTLYRTKDKIHINIYRKPTTTDHAINIYSNHPHTHKMAAFRFFVNRMLTLPISNNNIRKETRIIKQIARSNGYNNNIINTLIRKHKLNNKKQNHNLNDNNNKQYTLFTYINHETYNLTKMIKKKYNINPAYKTNNTQLNRIHNNKIENNDPYNKSGVYLFNCNEAGCNCSYVGQTGRSFHKRYKEHRRLTTTNPSAISNHMWEENHKFSKIEDDFKILHFMNKGTKLNILETIEIQNNAKNNDNNLNDLTVINNNILFTLLDN